jgi:hypothetical protein
VTKLKEVRLAGHVACTGELKYLQLFSLKSERKRPFRFLGIKYGDKIKFNLKEMGCEVVDWIHLAQDRVKWQAVLNTIANV